MDGERTLSRLQQHLYAVGHFGVSIIGYMMVQPVLKYYFPDNPAAVNLVPAALAPYILLLGRVTDGINDPVIGHISDSLRTRWGRRKPLMLVGLPALCALFILLWHPPVVGASVTNFWYASLVAVLYFVGFTVYTGPYLALLADITRSGGERRGLAGLQGVYNVCGLIAAGFLLSVCRGAGWGYPETALLITALGAVAMALPLLGPRDDPARVARSATPPLVRSVRMTLSSRPFRLYVTSQLLFLSGLFLVVQSLPYIVETLLRQETDAEAGTLTGIALLAGVLSVPLLLRLAARLGKKRAYQFSMLWFSCAAGLLALLGAVGGRPEGLWLARALVVFSGIGVAGLFAIPYAILSDITDHDRARTGMERQGVYFCVQGLILKAAYGLAPFVVGQMLVSFPADKVVTLSLMGPLAALFGMAAFVVFMRYPEAEVQAAVEAVQRGTERSAAD